uniref:Uncharacterized protein n=1 Tax=Ciona intestinalis TaxID=7719 RepID=H2XZG9_CIOIN
MFHLIVNKEYLKIIKSHPNFIGITRQLCPLIPNPNAYCASGPHRYRTHNTYHWAINNSLS